MSLGQKLENTSKNLGEYEITLNELGFFRAHQSSIINLTHVTGFNRNDRTIEMIDGSNVTMSRHRKNEFFERFNWIFAFVENPVV